MTAPPTPRRIDVERLRERASKATPGPWMNESHEGDRTVTPAWLCQHERWPIASGIGPDCPDMEFIAAANPATVLALLAELEAARAVIEASRQLDEGAECWHDHHGYCQEHCYLGGPCGVAEYRAALAAYDRAIAGDTP